MRSELPRRGVGMMNVFNITLGCKLTLTVVGEKRIKKSMGGIFEKKERKGKWQEKKKKIFYKNIRR